MVKFKDDGPPTLATLGPKGIVFVFHPRHADDNAPARVANNLDAARRVLDQILRTDYPTIPEGAKDAARDELRLAALMWDGQDICRAVTSGFDGLSLTITKVVA